MNDHEHLHATRCAGFTDEQLAHMRDMMITLGQEDEAAVKLIDYAVRLKRALERIRAHANCKRGRDGGLGGFATEIFFLVEEALKP